VSPYERTGLPVPFAPTRIDWMTNRGAIRAVPIRDLELIEPLRSRDQCRPL